jgi:hypothetical protein
MTGHLQPKRPVTIAEIRSQEPLNDMNSITDISLTSARGTQTSEGFIPPP